jgi:chaperonin cofactor prefoldin
LFDVLQTSLEETEGAMLEVKSIDDDQLILKVIGLGVNEEFLLSTFVG